MSHVEVYYNHEGKVLKDIHSYAAREGDLLLVYDSNSYDACIEMVYNMRSSDFIKVVWIK